MSKINAIRLINVNYNNNAYRISDETMYFNGESTLLSLQNGGGKSVLVQMLTAPFVHQRYRTVCLKAISQPINPLLFWWNGSLTRAQAMSLPGLW